MKSLRKWARTPTFGPKYRFWTEFLPALLPGLGVTQLLGIMIAAAFLNPVRWGTWSLWLAAGIMMTLDAAVVLLIYRRIRHAHLTPA